MTIETARRSGQTRIGDVTGLEEIRDWCDRPYEKWSDRRKAQLATFAPAVLLIRKDVLASVEGFVLAVLEHEGARIAHSQGDAVLIVPARVLAVPAYRVAYHRLCDELTVARLFEESAHEIRREYLEKSKAAA